MKPDKHMDDLEYLSQLGFENVPVTDSDIKMLRKTVRKRLFSGHRLLYSGLFGAVMGLLAGFLFFHSSNNPPNTIVMAGKTSLPTARVDASGQIPTTLLDCVTIVRENFRIPEMNKIAGQSSDSLEPGTVYLEPHPGFRIPGPDLKVEKLKFILNSPVFYVEGLKVTNYSLLYFRKDHFREVQGVPANMTSQEMRREGTGSLKNEPHLFLHEELANALFSFRKGRYHECITSLTVVEKYNDEDLNSLFYKGMSFYYLKDYLKAISMLDACVENSNNTFLQEANFYKALSLRAIGKELDARKILTQIAEEGEFYSAKAKELLKN
ncbi:MAG: hypothetical protein PSX36_16470 [bacterium]|nr:hypothetical protein [bacterium]